MYYRVAMTLDIMLLVVASIVFFEFQPLTAVMIVVLALLDDIPIMTIAYDNVSAAPKPERWNMHRVLVFSCLMGLLSLAESFGLLLIGLEWISDPARLRGHSARPGQPADHGVPATGGRRASAAVRGAHAAFGVRAALSERAAVPRHRRRRRSSAILICGFGILVPKLSWPAIAAVWVYSLIWMVVIDIAKLIYYRAVADGEAHATSSRPA